MVISRKKPTTGKVVVANKKLFTALRDFVDDFFYIGVCFVVDENEHLWVFCWPPYQDTCISEVLPSIEIKKYSDSPYGRSSKVFFYGPLNEHWKKSGRNYYAAVFILDPITSSIVKSNVHSSLSTSFFTTLAMRFMRPLKHQLSFGIETPSYLDYLANRNPLS